MYYAAYGSNLNFEQMAVRCPHSKFICTGYAKGWKLYFNRHADIFYTGDKNEKALIGIWDIADEDWAMLDTYEGCPKYYIKANIDVMTDNGKMDCVVYLMTGNMDYEFPDMYYLEIISKGYEHTGLDKKYLYDALIYTADMGMGAMV